MKLYLKKKFSIDSSVKKNPPLSEKGIREARLFQLMMSSLPVDFCFTDSSVAGIGSAMLLVGDKLEIGRDSRLEMKKSTELVEKNVQSFLSDLKELSSSAVVLILAEENILSIIEKNFFDTTVLL